MFACDPRIIIFTTRVVRAVPSKRLFFILRGVCVRACAGRGEEEEEEEEEEIKNSSVRYITE